MTAVAKKRSLPSRIGLFLLGSLLVVLSGEVGTTLLVDDDELLRWHDYGTQLKVEQMDGLVAEGSEPTVVIAGTSMAQQAFVPRTIAEEGRVAQQRVAQRQGDEDDIDQDDIDRYYNAALNGGVPVVMERWLLDQVVPRVRPERVVWGVSSIDLSATYGEASDNAYRQALSTKAGRLASLDRWVSSRSRFVAARAVLRRPSALWGSAGEATRSDAAAARAELGQDGERRNFTIDTSPERAAELRQRIAPFALDADDIAAIVRTVDALRRQGIEVALVELPVPPRLIELYPEGPATHARFQKAMAQLGQELEIEYVPLEATAVPYRDEDFVDFTHLTEAAARRFSRGFAEL